MTKPKSFLKALIGYFFGEYISPDEVQKLVERGYMAEAQERIEISADDRQIYALSADAEYAIRHTVALTERGQEYLRGVVVHTSILPKH